MRIILAYEVYQISAPKIPLMGWEYLWNTPMIRADFLGWICLNNSFLWPNGRLGLRKKYNRDCRLQMLQTLGSLWCIKEFQGQQMDLFEPAEHLCSPLNCLLTSGLPQKSNEANKQTCRSSLLFLRGNRCFHSFISGRITGWKP